jgi:hypothetical protein
MPLLNCAINHTKGLNILINNSITMDAGRAIFSGFLAAKVLGVVSVKLL